MKKSGKVTSEGTTFIYSGGMEHKHGVGIFFDESTAKCVSGFWCLSERVMVVRLKGRPFDISLIQCYAPTADNNDDEIDKFYEKLDEAIKQCRSQDIRIIMGDFNAKVGGQRDGRAVGPFGLGQRNERGSRLVEWCTANRFVITNTWFQHHMKNLYTWRSPGDTCRNQIDYIMINERFRNAIKGVRTYPGADCDSDHNLLMSKLCINLRKLKRSKVKPKMKWNALLEDTELKAIFCQKVEERKTLQKALMNSAQECIPKYGMTAKKKWMTSEILDQMEMRRRVKKDTDEYRRVNMRIRNMCRAAKEEYLNQQCEEIEELENRNIQIMHEKVKAVVNKKIWHISSCIKDEDGNVIMEQDQIKGRWTEYINSLYSDTERKDKPVIGKQMNGNPTTREEVRDAMKQMKKNKAVGNDEIAFEMIEALGNFGHDKITDIANFVYESENVPDEMIESIFIALPKKPGTTDCKAHRTISLMSHVTKIILHVILNRNKTTIREKLSDEQFGYKPGKGTRNATLCLRAIIEKCIEKQKDLYICFIDYVKAFDCVKHDKLLEFLERLDIDGKDIRLIRNLYYGQKAAIRITGEIGEWVDIQKGVRQGCILSPDLFNLYSEEALRKIKTCDGVHLGGAN